MKKIPLWDVFESFLASLNAQATQRSYRWPLRQFQKYLTEKVIRSPWEAQEHHLLEFFTRLRWTHKDSTAGTARNALNSFFRHGIDFQFTSKNPAARLSKIRLNIHYNPSPLTQDERRKLLLSLRYRNYSEARISVAFLLGLQEGMRVGEVCALRWENVDFENESLTFFGKGPKERSLPMSQSVKAGLVRLKGLQENQFGDPRLCPVRYVFASIRYHDQPPNCRHFQTEFKRMAAQCNISQGHRFHHLRHTMATAIVEAGGDVFELKSLMGWDRLETAQHYVEVNQEKLKATHQRATGSMVSP